MIIPPRPRCDTLDYLPTYVRRDEAVVEGFIQARRDDAAIAKEHAKEHGRQLVLVTMLLTSAAVFLIDRFAGDHPDRGTLASNSSDTPKLANNCSVHRSSSPTWLFGDQGDDDEGSTTHPLDFSLTAVDRFASVFVNQTCVLLSPDPCLVHKLNAFSGSFFEGLRVERLVAVFFDAVVTFSLTQLGGIPRPVGPLGACLYWMWMAALTTQWLSTFTALLLRCAAFFAMRYQLRICLNTINGVPLLDLFAAATFGAQPVLVTGIVSMMVFAFALSTGLTVLAGKELTRREFVKQAAQGKIDRATMDRRFPAATLHSAFARMLLIGSSLSPAVLAIVVPMSPELGSASTWYCVGFPWLIAAAVLAAGPERLQSCGRAAFACCASRLARRLDSKWAVATLGPFRYDWCTAALLLIPLVVGVDIYLVAGALVLGAVKLTYFVGYMVLECTAMGDSSCLGCFTSPVKTTLGWLGAMHIHKFVFIWQGSIESKIIKRTEADPSTLAAGLACFWGVLMLAPGVVYFCWAQLDNAIHPTVSAAHRIQEHHVLAYSNTFAFVTSLRIDWTELLPDFSAVMAMLEGLIEDPFGTVEHLLSAIRRLVHVDLFDPAYFLQAASSLDACTILLTGLKLGAAYGRKLYAAADMVRVLVAWARNKGEGHEMDDGTIQFSEAQQDVLKAIKLRKELVAEMEKMVAKCGENRAKALQQFVNDGRKAKDLRAAGFELLEMRVHVRTAYQPLGAFTVADMCKAGFAAAEVREVLGIPSNAREAIAHFSASDLRTVNFTAADLIAASVSVDMLNHAGFTAAELKAAGVSAIDLRSATQVSAAELKAAGFCAEQVRAAGFRSDQLREAAFSYAQLRAAGFERSDLGQVFTEAEIEWAELSLGVVGARVQNCLVKCMESDAVRLVLAALFVTALCVAALFLVLPMPSQPLPPLSELVVLVAAGCAGWLCWRLRAAGCAGWLCCWLCCYCRWRVRRLEARASLVAASNSSPLDVPRVEALNGTGAGALDGGGGGGGGGTGTIVLVLQLPPNFSTQELQSEFSPFGEITLCEMNEGTNSGRVGYESPFSADKAICMMNGIRTAGDKTLLVVRETAAWKRARSMRTGFFSTRETPAVDASLLREAERQQQQHVRRLEARASLVAALNSSPLDVPSVEALLPVVYQCEHDDENDSTAVPAPAAVAAPPTSPAPPVVAGPPSFEEQSEDDGPKDDVMEATLRALATSAEQLEQEPETGGDEGTMLAQLLQKLASPEPSGEDGEACEQEMMSPPRFVGAIDGHVLDTLVGQLLSKEVMLEPMQQLHAEFPRYLEANSATLSPSELGRYRKQQELVGQILEAYTQAPDDTDRIAILMQEMQQQGPPPPSISAPVDAPGCVVA